MKLPWKDYTGAGRSLPWLLTVASLITPKCWWLKARNVQLSPSVPSGPALGPLHRYTDPLVLKFPVWEFLQSSCKWPTYSVLDMLNHPHITYNIPCNVNDMQTMVTLHYSQGISNNPCVPSIEVLLVPAISHL